MWTDFFSSSPNIEGTFGDHPPELKGLTLVRVVLHESYAVLFLDFSSLPLSAPKRWQERKVTLQVRFDVEGADDAAIAPPKDWGLCCINIDEKEFLVVSNTGQTLFRSSYTQLLANFLPDEHIQRRAEESDRFFSTYDMEHPRRQP